MIIAAVLFISASCKTLIEPLSRQQFDQMSNVQVAQRHDALLDCNKEEPSSALEELKVIVALEDANAVFLVRAIDYLRDLHLDKDFFSQPAKKASK